MSMGDVTRKVLLVDDDERLLASLTRTHRKEYDLTTAVGGPAGLSALETSGPFAVVVSDFQMPVMDGITFLRHARQMAPDTVRILLTGNPGLQLAVDAVNEGSVFRFLTKPCAPETFQAGVGAAIEQFRLKHMERILLEQTLRGSVDVLVEILGLVNPTAFGRARRVRDYVAHVVHKLKLDDAWQFETAALLSQIGCVALPGEVLEKAAAGEALDAEETAMIGRHPRIARNLLRNIPRLEGIARIVEHQSLPGRDGLRFGSDLPLGSRILAVASEYDSCVSKGTSRADTLRILRDRASSPNRELIDALADFGFSDEETVVKEIPVALLDPGMLLDQDVVLANGSLLVSRDHEVTMSMVERLGNFARLGTIPASIRVRVKRTD